VLDLPLKYMVTLCKILFVKTDLRISSCCPYQRITMIVF